MAEPADVNVDTMSKMPVADQLNYALGVVALDKRKLSQLYASVRTYLLRLSMFSLLFSSIALKEPIGECLRDVRSWNDQFVEDERKISVGRAAAFVLQDVTGELMALAMAVLLVHFLSLQDPPGTFSTWSYVLASFLLPSQLVAFFQKFKAMDLTCVPEFSAQDGKERSQRMFPVVTLYFLVVSGAYWYMNSNINTCNANMEKIMTLQKQLREKQQEQNQETKEDPTQKKDN